MDLWLQKIDEVADRSINDHQKLQHRLVQEDRKSFVGIVRNSCISQSVKESSPSDGQHRKPGGENWGHVGKGNLAREEHHQLQI